MKKKILKKIDLVEKLDMKFDEVIDVFSEETLSSMMMLNTTGGDYEINILVCDCDIFCTYSSCPNSDCGSFCSDQSCPVFENGCGVDNDCIPTDTVCHPCIA